MKKLTKIILIIAGSLAALGIVFSGIAAVMGAGWSTIHRKALAGELDFGNWHIGNGVYYAYDQGQTSRSTIPQATLQVHQAQEPKVHHLTVQDLLQHLL